MSDLYVGRCSTREMFLKNLQNSQENTCARVSLLKDKTPIQVPPDEFCYIFKTLVLENNLLYLLHYYFYTYCFSPINYGIHKVRL